MGIKRQISNQLVSVFHFTCRIAFTYGLLNYFDQAENGFISALTDNPNNDYHDIIVEYQAIADFNAGGTSVVDPNACHWAVNSSCFLINNGRRNPKEIYHY
jgi:uracil phosphoribosyltransferase